ncbi:MULTISPECIES: MogA/MoaB family molybdenum cofactor biosynthesis protein [Brevibacterium]|uniref:Molybdenum cofactor synthesis domain-containing protein n=1 Tax=Brevibacterium antiquum CNRZ 918 TaxID=1255637 RepID=A0A2H1K2A9_9MICO|nr:MULTISPECIES: MogA/MoaB family molybdenum cofactor biosynthesis protein [Brevibacterium]SMX93947.1 molybdenum cofactor synthesis domain-containing protein [Brevibacterium antiquum CNRZ 918]HCG55639.1 MogA/MoaB family molybdenum cofactor biosynthesis protein [Brevibacterium sp.]
MSSETNTTAGAQTASQTDDLLGAGRSAAVIIASTSAARGEAADTTGPILVDWLRTRGYETSDAIVVRDGEPVGQALHSLLIDTPENERPRIIVTSGGTGLAPDDRTPEFTAELLERQSPGLIYAMWRKGLEATTSAVMSRGVAGVRGRSFVINFPGSKGGVKDGITVIDELLEHIQTSIEDTTDHGPRV